MKLPCKECLLIPICRLKLYLELIGECSHMYDYLMLSDKPLHRKRLRKIHKYLNIKAWLIGEQQSDEDGGGYTVLRGEG